ncbi:MAG: hypothetical protein A3C82_00365 [Candidatus Wildermuthbacteria bacterium RIFCSPHIGHO2_02_FULL_47_12]|uniref:Bacterial Ig-like domain-containing protein n=1 Tax=Candidatus Wildermuthbacteria bacterium RIFCSPHIGHO2_02_FULL_47_12 TaxID=1802451 RepID=A0A1G2R631_9BACT|nr:MAG: hypothetical protein A3C82_00365 [Candidatus Wildermuthbacteria bacterium RIFCSPHIGHO2_02_FULL_47_12]
MAGNVITADPTSGATFTVDNTAPTNQNTVFAASASAVGGAAVTVVSSGDATNAIWFAPSGTTSFTAGATKTTAGGTATSILAPATAGSYKMFVLDAAGNASSESTATLTVDNTAPTAAITYSDADGIVKSGDSLVITATFNEAMADSPVVKIAITGANTLVAANMTKTDSTHYTYSHTVGAGNGTATVALSVGTDVAGNVITADPTSGATFTVDNTAPTTVSGLASSSHTASTWSADTTIDVSWTAATDTGGSGVAGYSYLFDTSATTTPDTTSDGAGTSTTSGAQSDGNSMYFHVRAADNAENWGSASHLGPFYVDTTAPTAPGTPSTTIPTSDTTPTWTWTASTDASSGLHATTPYTVQWCTNSGFTGCAANTATSTTNSYTHSVVLADNTWYFKAKAMDALSQESSYSSNGSIVLGATGGGGSVITLLGPGYEPPVPPAGGFKVAINNGAGYTNTPVVALALQGGSNTAKMMVSDRADFAYAMQETYAAEKTWSLCSPACPDGEYTVYAKFYTSYGDSSSVVSSSIVLDTRAPKIALFDARGIYSAAEHAAFFVDTEAKADVMLQWNGSYGLVFANEQGRATVDLGAMPAGSYRVSIFAKDMAGNTGEASVIQFTVEPIKEVVAQEPVPAQEEPRTPIVNIQDILPPFIPELFLPKQEEAQEEQKKEIVIVPQEAPLVMSEQWNLFSEQSLEAFVLAPLPGEITRLTQKFLALGKTFQDIGVTKITDLEKLKSVKLTLPGLTDSPFQGMPVVALSPDVKKALPTEVVFAKTGGEVIDLSISLTFKEDGKIQQSISTLAGKPLHLTVKPESPAKSIKGYVVFKSKKPSPTLNQMPFHNVAASVLFAEPVFAYAQEQPVRTEELLLFMEFEYADLDGDGIYTAEIQAPLVAGEYEIITVMDYEDLSLGTKEIRLTTVIDPEGYVYTQLPEGKTRIVGAVVSLFWLNPKMEQYQLWPAKEYQQENPQITDDTGIYSFLVPPGLYYLKVEAPHYPVYQSDAFSVEEGKGIHMNIELKGKFWWLQLIDWKIFVVVIFGVLLLYNFYRDTIREKWMKSKNTRLDL